MSATPRFDVDPNHTGTFKPVVGAGFLKVMEHLTKNPGPLKSGGGLSKPPKS